MYHDNDNGGDVDLDILPNISCYPILTKFTSILWYIIKNAASIMLSLLMIIYSLFGYYLMWIALHYAAVHLYPMYCAPLTISGFILSPFMVSAPHCVAMRWLVSEGSNVIVTMWVAIGAYAIQQMVRRPNNV
jgi:hypothetical protein